jgi:hypothetical protein
MNQPSNTPIIRGQLGLGFDRPYEKDRNFDRGGRSFYFFDFDDNVASLKTTIVIFHRHSGHELQLSSVQYYKVKHLVGVPGTEYADYVFNFQCERTGSYRNFRDLEVNSCDMNSVKQPFIRDIETILALPDREWKAPSWDFFHYATFNQRAISIITARGHEVETIKTGIDLLVKHGHIGHRPNYLGIYPVSNPQIRKELGDENLTKTIPQLKKMAIKKSVYQAINLYGEDRPHRFGMSDDDPHNVALISEAMFDLKKELPHMSFFVIDTGDGQLVKREVLVKGQDVGRVFDNVSQLPLFPL